MYAMDDLLHLVHSDGADELKLHVGQPPVVSLDGKQQLMEGPSLTAEDAEKLFQSIADSRQRRALWKRGTVEFLYRFRERASFLVRASVESGTIRMVIH